MSVQAAPAKSAKYLYAIIDLAQTNSEIPDLGEKGIGESRVFTIADSHLAAVVSDVPAGKIRPQRKHLAAHQEVLKQLLHHQLNLLPMSFGVIADSPQSVARILREHSEAFSEQLQRIAGRVEMGVRLTWDVPNIFEYFVNTFPDLQDARERLLSDNTQEGRIEAGRLFDQLHTAQRELAQENVETVLASCCTEIRVNRCRNEREVLNLACLVERAKLPEFEQAIYRAADLFDDNHAIEFNGPWAPHNFVELSVEF